MTKIYALFLLVLLFPSCAVKEFNNSKKLEKQPEILTKQETIKIEVSHDFVQGSEDLPLLVGMEKIFEESLGFDSASGSIMSSSYETKISAEKIKSFYQKTLPQMGWKMKKTDSKKLAFKRENENLEIEISSKDNEKSVAKFFISSAIKSAKKN
jgi:hypothetical protein